MARDYNEFTSDEYAIAVLHNNDEVDEYLDTLDYPKKDSDIDNDDGCGECRTYDGNPVHTLLKTKISCPLTIVQEMDYVDSAFRDTFYNYYSSKHNCPERNCIRLSIFNQELKLEDFICGKEMDKRAKLQDGFVGTIILRPFKYNYVGKVLLDPSKLKTGEMYVRTTTFDVEVLGNILTINAYPFSGQDVEFMTCAETSIWTILQYYGTRYPEYRVILPSEIFKVVDAYHPERCLPSTGLNFLQKSTVLKNFGFSPKSYNINVYKDQLKNILHYYVESGIPVAMSLNRHAVVCIGHGEAELKSTDCKYVDDIELDFKLIDSASFFQKYVIIDDNRVPYAIDTYDKLKTNLIIVPLHKRIFLDALDARSIAIHTLKALNDVLTKCLEEYTHEGKIINPLVMRLFLTSSRKYIAVRSANSVSPNEASIYINLKCPKFVWVCEISNKKLYNDHKIIGEIVMDATAHPTASDCWESLLAIRLGQSFAFRTPGQSLRDLCDALLKPAEPTESDAEGYLLTVEGLNSFYPQYINNLKHINYQREV
ncbi:hypothetical protein [Candidatus Methanomassiliicoccus intestinalis]|uniref:hypothetical protein n=1 Tax=Candidatus Methanomassiliicoccus intestinalis TaxID=1406512 RepID=UPI0037DDBD2D